MRFYLSHPITGGNPNATASEKQANCQDAAGIGKIIHEAIPSADIYVPGGPSEEFVGRAYTIGLLSIEQILAVDCKIIDDCEAVLLYNPDGGEVVGGCLVEMIHAELNNIPVFEFSEFEDAIGWLNEYILRV